MMMEEKTQDLMERLRASDDWDWFYIYATNQPQHAKSICIQYRQELMDAMAVDGKKIDCIDFMLYELR